MFQVMCGHHTCWAVNTASSLFNKLLQFSGLLFVGFLGWAGFYLVKFGLSWGWEIRWALVIFFGFAYLNPTDIICTGWNVMYQVCFMFMTNSSCTFGHDYEGSLRQKDLLINGTASSHGLKSKTGCKRKLSLLPDCRPVSSCLMLLFTDCPATVDCFI